MSPAFLSSEKSKSSQANFYVTVADMLVNVQGGSRKPHYLKLGITLQVKTNDDAKRVNEDMPQVIDEFLMYLIELRLEDLQGAEGLMLLKRQLLERARMIYGNAQIVSVLFRSMLLQ